MNPTSFALTTVVRTPHTHINKAAKDTAQNMILTVDAIEATKAIAEVSESRDSDIVATMATTKILATSESVIPTEVVVMTREDGMPMPWSPPPAHKHTSSRLMLYH